MHSKSDKYSKHLFQQLTWSDVDRGYVCQLIELAKEEDLAGAGLSIPPSQPGDATTRALPVEELGKADVVARKQLTVCGLPLIEWVLKAYGKARFEACVRDGECVEAGTILGTISGEVSTILQAERVLLNFLQHLSGVATQTARWVQALGDTSTRLLDTRKTTPGFRVLEKYAVSCGGAWNHRIGLFDRVMLKDNHLAITGTATASFSKTVQTVRTKNPDLAVEVEIDRVDQLASVLAAKPDVILLDNFAQPDLVKAIALIGDQAYTEASGGITETVLAELGQLGLDFISCGALIHQSTWVDIGLDWKE